MNRQTAKATASTAPAAAPAGNEGASPAGHRFVAHTSRDGMYIGGYDVSYTEDIGLSIEQPPSIFLGLMLSGRSTRICVNGTGEFEIPVGRPIVLNFSEPTVCTNFYKAGEHCAGVGISLSPEFFNRHGDGALAAGLQPLRALVDNFTDIEVLEPCPEMARLANQVLEADSDTAPMALVLEGFGYLLLAGFCARMQEARNSPGRGRLSAAEWRRTKKVADHLRENLAETPSLGALSRLAGVNQTTLSSQFKSVHGETIFAYLRNRRLDTARMILRTENVSITDVSFRVGFSSSTSFTTAYRRRFGYPPSQETNDF